jgi:DNA repair exonuclease SbcCD ATPase subunit
LQAAELNQRRVGRMLVVPAEGVPALIEAMRREMEINRDASSEMRETMDGLTAELQRLADGPISGAESELTATRKALETDSSAPQDVSRSLAAAGQAQEDVISTLERVIGKLAGRIDYRRFARLLTELRQDQIDHEQATRKEVRVDTLTLRLNELTRNQRAVLQKAVAGQTALASRFEKIEQGMDQMARDSSAEQSEVAGILNDAVDLARSLAIASKMNETAADLGQNRVSGALAREQQIAADLQQVIDVLRGQQRQEPEQSIEKLRNAQEQLANLQKQLAELRNKIGQSERQPAQATPEQLKSLNEEQQNVRSEIEKLARQLDRLDAANASQSAQNAANRLDNEKQNENRPSPSNEVQKSEQDLNEASKQLAEQRQQAEEDLALEIVRRFQQQLTEMVEQQKTVIDSTVKLDTTRTPNEPLSPETAAALKNLANQERELANMAKEHSELLVGLGAVRVSLEDAERRLAAAASLLDKNESGASAQQAERHALARLEGMMDAFAQTANEAAPNPQQQPPPGAGAQPNQPQHRPTFELLEVKMLRMLQVDLQQRTKEHQERVAGLQAPNAAQQAELLKETQELAAEQGRLAELVENMLSRDNEQQQHE